MGIDETTSEHPVHGLGLADRARQALGTPGPRHDAELDLRLREAGAVCGDDQIAHHGQLTAAPQGDTFDGRDDGLADASDGFPVAGDEVVAVGIHEVVVAHGSNVGASGKGAGAPRQDDGTDVGVPVEHQQGVAELVHQGIVQGVELLGAIEADEPHAAMGLGLDASVLRLRLAHGVSWSECRR